jgi:hypothetical protein
VWLSKVCVMACQFYLEDGDYRLLQYPFDANPRLREPNIEGYPCMPPNLHSNGLITRHVQIKLLPFWVVFSLHVGSLMRLWGLTPLDIILDISQKRYAPWLPNASDTQILSICGACLLSRASLIPVVALANHSCVAPYYVSWGWV